MHAVINRMKYDTATATALADDERSDGRNALPGGRGCCLYVTPGGRYFAHHQTVWDGEHDSIEPLTLEEAEELYERLPNHYAPYEEAFPTVEVEEA